jgi:hypothetical protein
VYFHGSKFMEIKTLIPDISLHGDKYVYLTTSLEVALIYTVNAIESYYEENHLVKSEKFQPWFSYGFNKEKIPVIEEYYPNATKETYSNKPGYIYICEELKNISNPTNIFNAVVTKEEVNIKDVIYVEDVYKKVLDLEKQGKMWSMCYNIISNI